MTRRNVLRLLACATPLACVGDAVCLEPGWLAVRHRRVGAAPTRRLVHFSDLHYKGDRSFLEKVVRRINDLSPDFACFTGDIVEDTAHLAAALDVLAGINCPLYGVAGNHDFWSGASFEEIGACFRSTGGGWLLDRETAVQDGICLIEGRLGTPGPSGEVSGFVPGRDTIVGRDWSPRSDRATSLSSSVGSAGRRILLTHYPAYADALGEERYDLILAGHSHGGQVRLPLVGALIVPFGVGDYDAGLFDCGWSPLLRGTPMQMPLAYGAGDAGPAHTRTERVCVFGDGKCRILNTEYSISK